MHDIQDRLKARFPSLLIGTYSGAGGNYYDPDKNMMIGVERDIIKHRFVQGHIDILLCTDAAAEGLNLQIADLLINYDLPWNPMKVEQRIGRIDRIGQKYNEIFVLNLCFADSAEQFVYERLLGRLAQANLVVGSQQFSILPVTSEEFRALAEGSLSENQVEQHAMERVARQKANKHLMEVPAEEMFNIYVRLSQTYREQPIPLTLPDIWDVLTQSEFLKQLGCAVSECNKYITLKGVDTIKDGVAITVDRALFDEGLPNDNILYFATLGEPVFERLLTFILGQSNDLPYKIIETEYEGISAAAIAYTDKNGRNQIVTSVKQALKANNLAEKFNEQTIQRTVAQLESYCSMQSRNFLKMEGIEKNNRKQADAQVLLNNQIVRSLMSSKLKTSQLDDNASVFLRALEEQFHGRDTPIRIRDIPHCLEHKLSAGIVTPHFPLQGDGHVDTPILIVKTALESLARHIDGSRTATKRQTASGVIEAIKEMPDKIY